MIKLIVFDLDSTLAPSHKATPQSEVQRVKNLEKNGVKIAVCSGKTTYYLCGFMRQFGLDEPILIGENGLTIQYGVTLPPKEYYQFPLSDIQKEYLSEIKSYIDTKFPEIWYQPNVLALTPFITKDEQFATIDEFLRQNTQYTSCLQIYKLRICYDILPKGVSKKSGIEFVCRNLNIKPDEVITVGDGLNDYPMFEFSKTSVGINVADESKVTANFKSLAEALDFIEQKVDEK